MMMDKQLQGEDSLIYYRLIKCHYNKMYYSYLLIHCFNYIMDFRIVMPIATRWKDGNGFRHIFSYKASSPDSKA